MSSPNSKRNIRFRKDSPQRSPDSSYYCSCGINDPTQTWESIDNTTTTTGQPEDSTQSTQVTDSTPAEDSTIINFRTDDNELYKMTAYKPKRAKSLSPTKIEFNLINCDTTTDDVTKCCKKRKRDPCKQSRGKVVVRKRRTRGVGMRSHCPKRQSRFKRTRKRFVSKPDCFKKRCWLCKSSDNKAVDKKQKRTPLCINKKYLRGKITDMKKRRLTSKFASSRRQDECIENLELYYFDHGNAAYFRTTDAPPFLISDLVTDQTKYFATKFWAEVFGTLSIGVAFIITLLIQFYRFLLAGILRPIIIGVLQMTSDYFLKPILTVLFNGILQPILIFCYNLLTSICDMFEPLTNLLTQIVQPVAILLGSIRLCEYKPCNNPCTAMV